MKLLESEGNYIAFFALVSSGTLLNYLLGESVPLKCVFLTMVSLDLCVSSFNLYGLFTKFITFPTIICAALLDMITPVVGISLPINVALIWHESELRIAWLEKWQRVFERDVGNALIKTIRGKFELFTSLLKIIASDTKLFFK